MMCVQSFNVSHTVMNPGLGVKSSQVVLAVIIWSWEGEGGGMAGTRVFPPCHTT